MRFIHCKAGAHSRCWARWIGLLFLMPILAMAERLPIKVYTTSDGLAHDRVRRIVRDAHGFLWFVTAEGLSRFDGYRFINYGRQEGLPTSSVNDLLITRNGSYLVAPEGQGVYRFNLKNISDRNPRFTPFPLGNGARAQDVRALYEDRAGRVWAATGNGLLRLETVNGQDSFASFDLHLPSGDNDSLSISSLIEDREGSLWLGTSIGLLRLLPTGDVIQYAANPAPTSSRVRGLLQDRDGRIWFGHDMELMAFLPEPAASVSGGRFSKRVLKDPSGGVAADGRVSLPARIGDFRRYTLSNGLIGKRFRSLLQTSDGTIWIGMTGGLGQFDGVRFRSFSEPHGVIGLAINTLLEDEAGNLWVGTDIGGALKFTLSGFTSFKKADGMVGDWVTAIMSDQSGRVYTMNAGDFYINCFDGQKFQAAQPNLPASVLERSHNYPHLPMQDHTGEWWIPTGAGLFRFPRTERIEQLAQMRPKAAYTSRDGIAGDDLYCAYEDLRGDVWIAAHPTVREGVTRWDRRSESFHRFTEADGLPPYKTPHVFAQDKDGALWLGFWEGGLARYRGGRFTLFSNADGVPNGEIMGLYVDGRGQLWIASGGGGLGRMAAPGTDRPRIDAYTMAEGLSSNQIYAVTEDQWGRIYFGTARGVDRLDPATGHIKHYTTADGLSLNEALSAFRDRQGALWFGSYLGVSRLVPQPDRPTAPPPILIHAVRVAGVPQPIDELGVTELSGLRLKNNQNQIEFDFFGLSFGPGEVLRYQYRIEGLDQDWRPLINERTVNFGGLAPGQYRFLARAINADGRASATPAAVSFTILPPLWKRWWFVSLLGLLSAVAVFVFERYRIARLLEIERVRMRIATDLHDDIGAGLSRIAILSEVAHGRLGTGDLRGRDHMTTIASSSRELLDSMSDIVWAINPQKEQLKDLIQRMRRFASDLLAGRNISFRFDAPEGEQDLKLSADMRREIFLIFKESVNNLARHSGATEAEITLRVDRRWLSLEIKDNGRGFDLATGDHGANHSDGNGLMSMRERARRLEGEFQIITEAGHGTTIRVRAPIQNQWRNWWKEPKGVEDPRRRNKNRN
jgi:signal transduction histidine kinase/ligand-binding sensor domain-containing protein